MAVSTDNFDDVITVNDVGVWRVVGTRVSIDSVLYAFKHNGATPEEIVEQYDTLDLEKVLALINYYLCNREKVDKYLTESEERKQAIYRESEHRSPRGELRSVLLARKELIDQGLPLETVCKIIPLPKQRKFVV